MDKKKIIVVDDDKGIRDMLKERLEASNYDVVLAGDGKTGLAKIEQDKPDLVLLDIKMPDMDGFTMLLELKKRLISMPVIILTGYRDMKDLFSTKDIADYIVKPFQAEDLLLKIAQVLNK